MNAPFGYVYVMMNPRHPGEYKIGKSSKKPETTRLKDANTFDPYGFKIVYKETFRNPLKKEQIILSVLKDYKINREWVKAPLSLIKRCMNKLKENPNVRLLISEGKVYSNDDSESESDMSDEDDSDDSESESDMFDEDDSDDSESDSVDSESDSVDSESDSVDSESDEDDSDDEDIVTVPWKYKGNYYFVDEENNLVYNRDTQEVVGKRVNRKLKKNKK